MRITIEIFSSFLEVSLLSYFFSKLLNRREIDRTTEILFDILFIAVFSLVSVTFLKSELAPAMFFITIIIFASLKYRDKVYIKLLWTLIIFVLSALSEIICALFLSIVYEASISDLQKSTMLYLQGAILSKLLLLVTLRAIGLFRIRGPIRFNYKSVLAVLLIPISSVISCYYITVIAYRLDNSILTFGVILTVFLIALSNMSTFYLLEKQIKLFQVEQELVNMERQYKLQSDYYTDLKEKMYLSSRNTHDIKNFVSAVSSYLDKNEITAAKDRIAEFVNAIPSLRKINTGNDAVDALIHSKMHKIKQIYNNNLSIIIPPNLNVDEIDLCIIIGNAVDNCIEACFKIEDSSKRFLSIKIFPHNDNISMLFENSTSEEKQQNILKTTKKHSHLHGFGIKNMENMVHKYGGSIAIEPSKNSFSVSILLPNIPVEQK